MTAIQLVFVNNPLAVSDTATTSQNQFAIDVLNFFKKEGDGYQRRINAVLRSYMQQKAKPKKRA